MENLHFKQSLFARIALIAASKIITAFVPEKKARNNSSTAETEQTETHSRLICISSSRKDFTAWQYNNRNRRV